MTTKIHIHDDHSSTEIELDKNVVIKATHGGCPVEILLKGLDCNRSVKHLAHRIHNRWLAAYEGDPEVSHPTVKVIRGSEQAVATI
jgi:hypothetical protein